MPTAERYYQLREAGLCTHCGQASAAPDRALCSDCLERRRERYATRRSAGSCAQCGRRHAGGVYCHRCRAMNHDARQARQERLGRRARCRQCQAPQSSPAAYCVECYPARCWCGAPAGYRNRGRGRVAECTACTRRANRNGRCSRCASALYQDGCRFQRCSPPRGVKRGGPPLSRGCFKRTGQPV